ncbi:MAG: aminotransferase class IV [Dehalococcoidales bacterium]|nr:aminotransferase class IV [Dehalococcoidales bacterium]
MEELVYLNGSLIPRSEAKVSIYDHGFLYGYGLFETMRAYHGKIFLLERHLKRLKDSADALGLNLAGIDLEKACNDTLSANNLKDARLRLTFTRGEVEGFPGPRMSGKPTVLVTAKSYTPLAPEVYLGGYRVLIASVRQNSQSPISRLKTTNYLLYLMARMEAEAAGRDEALLLNERGALTEGSTSNVFFVTPSGLVTPPLKSGLLPGVARQVVIELAQEQGVPISEVEVKPKDLPSFQEAFLTNSVMEIMPLVEIRDGNRSVAIGSGRPGRITLQLTAAYRKMVEAQTSK